MYERAAEAAFDDPSVAEHGLAVGVVGTAGLVASATRGLTEQSAVYIASVSKVFTATCVMIAADRGAVSLDDDIRAIIPELPAWSAAATVRHLLWHTAPLPDYIEVLEASGIDPHGVLTNELILDLLAAHEWPASPPGEAFAYSNTGYWLLGVALERVTGTPLRRFAAENVFGPLTMAATWYRDDYREQRADMAVGHVAPAVSHPASCFDRVGDGGVVSTLGDLARWASAVLRHEQPWYGLTERISAAVPLNDASISNWRAGVVLEEIRGQQATLVGGTALGYRAFGALLAAKRLGVIVLADLETANVRGAAFRVVKQLTG